MTRQVDGGTTEGTDRFRIEVILRANKVDVISSSDLLKDAVVQEVLMDTGADCCICPVELADELV